ncbi:alpha-galactosidase [Anaeromicropila herbilytica]|uniref:Alpha-galactosidase n=1 Tax=Anaeromicropila herbilytica TaxID=2785025 RepID=A0A7R7IEF9_9FIRM|nr:alpha-galactosidase [Anaeromicropila herbilytica]BCN32673.1 alpha-galactosidase [Anaeromicropila herbilytica]
MAILYNEKSRIFTIHSKYSTYQMQVDQYDYLLHLYYGSKIENQEMSYLLQYNDRGFSSNPYEVGKNRTYSLDFLPQEYSVFGMGDYRESCLSVVNEDGSYDIELKYENHTIYKGKKLLEGLPAAYGSEEEVETLEICLRDRVTNLEVTLSYSVFYEYDVITRSVKVKNGGSNAIWLDRALSVCLDFANRSDFDYITFYGKHTFERQLERTKVRHGKTTVDSVRGCSSHQQNPFVILCDSNANEVYGECYGFSFVYSGNFKATVELDQFNQTRFVMGINDTGFSYRLQADEEFIAPEVIMAYSEHGLGELSRKYHKVIQNHVCRGKYKKARRPILINNWEATYFDFTSEKLVSIAREASSLGIEMLVMDDGWFGVRNDDYSGLGDWFVNTDKISGGLKKLVEDVNQCGMKFGIWFEPEMINEDSELYREHPEWCLRTPTRKGNRSRYQYVLDMTRKDVRDYLYDCISKILEEANIEYIKWDMNRHLTNVYSLGLDKESQGEVYHRYVLGLYELLERLISKYQDVLFEGCSGGGGRFDAGMLYYTPQIWTSDNTDAIDRLKIQYGTSFCYPISSMGAHVSAVPNHQTGRITPLNTRGIVAMSGTFGYELDVNKMTSSEKEMVKEQVEQYKKHYNTINYGDYYRITDPYHEERYMAWQFVSENKEKMLLQYVLLKPECNAPIVNIKLQGLEPDQVYTVVGTSETYTGSALMKAGYRIPEMNGDYTAVQIEFEAR